MMENHLQEEYENEIFRIYSRFSSKKFNKTNDDELSCWRSSTNMHTHRASEREYICLKKLTRWRFERLNQYLNLEKIQINHQWKFFEKH
jgi:hypothetical protein